MAESPAHVLEVPSCASGVVVLLIGAADPKSPKPLLLSLLLWGTPGSTVPLVVPTASLDDNEIGLAASTLVSQGANPKPPKSSSLASSTFATEEAGAVLDASSFSLSSVDVWAVEPIAKVVPSVVSVHNL
ncbi:hypothetical protein ACA910_002357 [Epithemia clementina (nom. ined.)]